MNIATLRIAIFAASLIMSASGASAAASSDQDRRNGDGSGPYAGGRIVLAEDDMSMGKGGMGQPGGGMGHGGMKIEMDKMQPSGMPPAVAPQMGTQQQASPVPPQCPAGTSLKMDPNGQHLCK
jgi:hypothetical protein